MRYRPSRRSHRQQSSNGRRPRNVLPPPERHAIARFDHFAGRRTTADDISPTRRYRRRRQSRQKRRPSVGPTGPIGPSAPFAPSEPGAPFARFRAGRRRSAGELAPGRPRPRPPVGRRASTAETTTHLLAVRKRLCDVGSRRKLTQTTTTIATMRRYFPCSRRLIIIFSHQEDAPTGRAAAGARLADWLARPAGPAPHGPPGLPPGNGHLLARFRLAGSAPAASPAPAVRRASAIIISTSVVDLRRGATWRLHRVTEPLREPHHRQRRPTTVSGTNSQCRRKTYLRNV